MNTLIIIFVVLKLAQFFFERYLAYINRQFYRNPQQIEKACGALKIGEEEFQKTAAYTEDKYRFGMISESISMALTLGFLLMGGFGFVEQAAIQLSASWGGGEVLRGLIFFACLGLLSTLFSLPFDWYRTFTIEQRHGFNRQTKKGFFTDLLKGLILGAILGGLLIAGILWIMDRMGEYWWLWGWVAVSGFSIFAAWIYPTLLAPLFNKFRPLDEGELKDQIYDLAKRVGFKASGISIMDASRRSSHGNAYFTGVFGEKKIVLFDTLVDSMQPKEIVAVLAHELGHFKLHHVRAALLRSVATTGLIFFALSLCLPLEAFYLAFYFEGVSNYGALVVFGMWFGLISFFLQPLSAWMSRRNEFAADNFAKAHSEGSDQLVNALIKLRESNAAMPISHPLFSKFYHSHPPLVERIQALKG